MPLCDLVEGLDERLTEADRQLIGVLLANPQETAFLSTNEVAERAAVHPASAVRFARKLGFDGYPALRAKLQMELFGVSEAAERMRQRIKRLGTHSVIKTLVDSEIKTLNRLPEQVSDADIVAAARAVIQARQTFLFAVGHAAALAYLLETRLGRLGYRTQMLKHVARDMAVNLLQARAKDVFILFTLNAVNPLAPKIIKHARSIGAVSIVIGDPIGLTMQPGPDIVLAASRGAEGEPRSLTVPMTICNALTLQISRLDRRKTIHNLELLDDIRKKLEAAQ
ncbi:MAG: MurR/RpiR family transcriptional regulator [Burkholderiales bacterium]|nr:MurR/RpiR family transcriptional regulator [Burkholderiales bacterium]